MLNSFSQPPLLQRNKRLMRFFAGLSTLVILMYRHGPGTGSGDGAVEDAEEPDDESHHGLRVKARVLLSCWCHSHAHPESKFFEWNYTCGFILNKPVFMIRSDSLQGRNGFFCSTQIQASIMNDLDLADLAKAIQSRVHAQHPATHRITRRGR
jgi:hypothetical protein